MRCYQCRRMLGKHGAYYHAGYPFCYDHWLWRSGRKPEPDKFMRFGLGMVRYKPEWSIITMGTTA